MSGSTGSSNTGNSNLQHIGATSSSNGRMGAPSRVPMTISRSCANCGTSIKKPRKCNSCSNYVCEICLVEGDVCCLGCQDMFPRAPPTHVQDLPASTDLSMLLSSFEQRHEVPSKSHLHARAPALASGDVNGNYSECWDGIHPYEHHSTNSSTSTRERNSQNIANRRDKIEQSPTLKAKIDSWLMPTQISASPSSVLNETRPEVLSRYNDTSGHSMTSYGNGDSCRQTPSFVVPERNGNVPDHPSNVWDHTLNFPTYLDRHGFSRAHTGRDARMDTGYGSSEESIRRHPEHPSSSSLLRSPAIHTMMLCNIPCRVRQEDVVEALASKGFAGTYDFVNLPTRHGRNSSHPGYGFINFLDAEVAAEFVVAFEGYTFNGTYSSKKCTVKPANHQGFNPKGIENDQSSGRDM